MVDKAAPIPAGTVLNADGRTSVPITLDTATTMSILVKITAKSGTTPGLNIWLEEYSEGVGDYFPVPYHQQITEGATPGTDVSASAGRKNINGPAAATDVGKHRAMYEIVPGGKYFLRWALTGTTPTFTLGADVWMK